MLWKYWAFLTLFVVILGRGYFLSLASKSFWKKFCSLVLTLKPYVVSGVRVESQEHGLRGWDKSEWASSVWDGQRAELMSIRRKRKGRLRNGMDVRLYGRGALLRKASRRFLKQWWWSMAQVGGVIVGSGDPFRPGRYILYSGSGLEEDPSYEIHKRLQD